MDPARRSRTAEGAAFLRALHCHVDSEPWVFDDRAVEVLLPPAGRHFLRRLDELTPAWVGAFRRRRGALDSMRAQIVVRARYAEDALAAHAPCQYLILAAGLDTFALRNPDRDVQIFEADHPATQAWKRSQLTRAPENLLYVPVDFERTTLLEALTATEFDREQPTFVSWLGTTYYLTRDAITETLRGLRELVPPGTRVVLDYWSEAPITDGRATALLAGTRLATAFQSEPIRSLFAPAEMEALVGNCGWSIREHAAPVIQNARYLSNRKDGLAVPSFAYLIQLEC
jgi:methyltransferase (TIGR00027 family)